MPAAELDLTPVDQVFVRMGARDHIMAGQSTFLVELQETATMLVSCTLAVKGYMPCSSIIQALVGWY